MIDVNNINWGFLAFIESFVSMVLFILILRAVSKKH